MQSQNDRSAGLDPAPPKDADGYYYVDPTAPPAGSVSAPSDFPQDAAYGPPPEAALLLLLLFLLLLFALGAALFMRNGTEKPEDVIARALQTASRTALAAYGPATIGAASVLGSAVRKYLGPVLDLNAPVSAALKKLDDAGKGKTKEPAKVDPAAVPAPGARVVVMGDYHGPQPGAPDKPKEVERDMTSEEQIAACRKAVEDLAAVLMAPDFRQRIAAARRALNRPPPAPRIAAAASAATAPGGGASAASVGPRTAPAARRPRHT